jgi:class 3 adenylate cyclase
MTAAAGTLTFLFTDLEGSTRLLRSLGRERYADVVAEHGRLLQDAFASGRRIDTQGDSSFYVFPSAVDALSAAADAQRALAAHPWPAEGRPAVRVGVHTGEATVSGDRYFGLAVHRASRICAAAYGGQILLSATTRDVAEDALPADLELRHLGEYRLKDLERPERLFQLVVDGLQAEFPPLRTADEDPAFAGRERRLAAAAEAAVEADAEVRADDAEREAAVRELREHTAVGRLTLEEFSERVDEALGARTRGELALVRRQLPELAETRRRRPAWLGVAIFSHFVRRGHLRLRRLFVALSLLFGDLDLDLRQAAIDRGRATVLVIAIFGNADMYVPEGIDVDVSGIPLGGHVRDWGRDEPKEGSPRLRVRVFTLFGTADVFRVPPGAQGRYRDLIRQVKGKKPLPPPGSSRS